MRRAERDTKTQGDYLIEGVPMKYLIAACFLSMVSCAALQEAFAQKVDRCGIESEQAEARAESYLTDERYINLLALDGIDPPPVESLRVMTHAEDPEACAEIAFRKEEAERVSFFYVAGDYYFQIVLLRPRSEWVDRDGMMDAPRGLFIVYDSEFEGIAMYMH